MFGFGIRRNSYEIWRFWGICLVEGELFGFRVFWCFGFVSVYLGLGLVDLCDFRSLDLAWFGDLLVSGWNLGG